MKSFFGLLALVVIWIFCMYLIFKPVNDIAKGMKENVGNKVVIEKDTLIILDYSLLDESYNLSNGSKISKEILSKFKIIQKLKP